MLMCDKPRATNAAAALDLGTGAGAAGAQRDRSCRLYRSSPSIPKTGGGGSTPSFDESDIAQYGLPRPLPGRIFPAEKIATRQPARRG